MRRRRRRRRRGGGGGGGGGGGRGGGGGGGGSSWSKSRENGRNIGGDMGWNEEEVQVTLYRMWKKERRVEGREGEVEEFFRFICTDIEALTQLDLPLCR